MIIKELCFYLKEVHSCPPNLSCFGNVPNKEDEGMNKCTCGMPFNPRIVGGNEAKENSVPWQVKILRVLLLQKEHLI